MRDLVKAARAVHELLGRERPWRWLLLVGLGFLGSAIESLGAAAIFLLLVLLAAPENVVDAPLVGQFASFLPLDDLSRTRAVAAALVLAFFVIRTVFLIWRSFVEGRLTSEAGIEIAGRLMAGYLAMPYLFHTRRNTSELLRNTMNAAGNVATRVIRPLATFVADVIMLFALGLVALTAAPAGGAAALLFLAVVTVGIQYVLRPRLARWSRRIQDASRGSLQAAQQSLGGIRDIKLLGQESSFLAVYRLHLRKGARANYVMGAAKTIPRAVIELALVLAVVVLTLGVLATGANAGETLALVGLFAYAGRRMQPAIQSMAQSINTVRSSMAMIDDLSSDLASIAAWNGQKPMVSSAEPLHEPFRDALVLEGVHFTYAPEEPSVRPALHGVDLTVRRGEFLGICGPTGGGKSTLLDLLVGLLQPTEGRVMVDGRELDGAPTWWWAQLGVVSQQVFLTDDTLRRNIAFGVPVAEIDEARLARCIDRAQLDEMVAGLRDGLDTIVGERGIRLSGGQRQRVAVARALYREPPVVVLDEGTSALDGATEARLIAALDEVAPERTLIAVAHRIATLRDADRIIVIEGGRVSASGTYAELMDTSAVFRELAGVTSAG